jgi:hypothetical protein
VSQSFGCIPKSGIAGSNGRSMFRTLSHSDCTNLHSHQQCKKVAFSPTSSPIFVVVVFLMVVILTES